MLQTNIPEDWMRSMLQNNVMTVTFTKSNGEPRVMRCTLQESLIPPVTTSKPAYGDTIRVYDIEKNNWRSFKLTSVTHVGLSHVA